MSQYIGHIKVPSSGSIRHIVGFGEGDPGYDVLETVSSGNTPCVIYYYIKSRKKGSVSITEFQKKYFVEHCIYRDQDSVIPEQKNGGTLRNVTNEYLQEAVKAYRAYRMLHNEYTGFRNDILDSIKQGIECIYLGNMAKGKDRLTGLLNRSGFHVESFDFNTISTKEGICLSLDGLCFKKDEIIP